MYIWKYFILHVYLEIFYFKIFERMNLKLMKHCFEFDCTKCTTYSCAITNKQSANLICTCDALS